jgi:hypothetical protein
MPGAKLGATSCAPRQIPIVIIAGAIGVVTARRKVVIACIRRPPSTLAAVHIVSSVGIAIVPIAPGVAGRDHGIAIVLA